MFAAQIWIYFRMLFFAKCLQQHVDLLKAILRIQGVVLYQSHPGFHKIIFLYAFAFLL